MQTNKLSLPANVLRKRYIKYHIYIAFIREAAKKFFFCGPATKREGRGGGRAWPLLKKITSFEALKKELFAVALSRQRKLT